MQIDVGQALPDVIAELPFTNAAISTFLNMTSHYKHAINQPAIVQAQKLFHELRKGVEVSSNPTVAASIATAQFTKFLSTVATNTETFVHKPLQATTEDSEPAPAATGTARIFMGAEHQAIDSTSICINFIPHGSEIWTIDSLGPVGQAMTAQALYAMISLANPVILEGNLHACDMTLMTYFCNFIYPPNVKAPMEVPAPTDEDPDATTTVQVDLPLLPCASSYRDGWLADACPDLISAGILASPDFAWGSDELCNAALSPAPRWTIDNTQPNGVVPTMPIYTCPLPFVTVDPFTYKFSRVMNGYCAMPCPDPISTWDERVNRDRIFLGFSIPSTIMGIFLLISYFSFAVLRERFLIIIAVASVQYQSFWIVLPYWHRVSVHGLGSGTGTACSLADAVPGSDGRLLSATPFSQSNFVCAMTGISGVFAMYASLGAVVCLGFTLVQRIIFGVNLTPQRKKLQDRLMIAFIFGVPTLFSIIVLAHSQFNGGGASCGVAKLRDSTSKVNLADSIGMLCSAVYVGIALVEMIWVIIYLAIFKLQVKETKALSKAQIRIFFLIVIMCSLYLAIYIFRALVEWRFSKPMGAAIGEWLICTLTTPGGQDVVTATCGEVAKSRIPSQWFDYLTYISASSGFTIFFAVGFSFDIIQCWAKLFYEKFGWQACKPTRTVQASAVAAPHTRSQNNPSSRTAGGGGDGGGASGVVSQHGSHHNSEQSIRPTTLFKKPAQRPVGNSVRPVGRESRAGSICEEFDSIDTVSAVSATRNSNQPLFESQNHPAEIEMEKLPGFGRIGSSETNCSFTASLGDDNGSHSPHHSEQHRISVIIDNEDEEIDKEDDDNIDNNDDQTNDLEQRNSN